MSIRELIEAVGHDNIKCQLLSECVTNATSTKNGTRVTLVTKHMSPDDLIIPDRGAVGILLWLPREKVNAAMAEEKALRIAEGKK